MDYVSADSFQTHHLQAWCRRWLEQPVRGVLHQSVHRAVITTVELDDGTRALIKARPETPRISGCTQVQAILAAGYPAAGILVPPQPLSGSWPPPKK